MSTSNSRKEYKVYSDLENLQKAEKDTDPKKNWLESIQMFQKN